MRPPVKKKYLTGGRGYVRVQIVFMGDIRMRG